MLCCFLLGIGPAAAFAGIQQDRMVSGGEPAAATTTQVSWAALGQPLGGRMSGGGMVVEAGGPGFSGNLPPRITASSPDKKKVSFYRKDLATLSLTATDPEGDSLSYRFLIDGVLLQDWSSLTSYSWDTTSYSFGWHTIHLEVKDAGHTVRRVVRLFLFWRPPSP